jgi:MoaA/NifB/PqqE/SkfB family radical SAM enzyme
MSFSLKRLRGQWLANLGRDILKVRFQKQSARGREVYPVLASYNITNRCDMRCVYCGYPQMDHRELETKDVLRVLEKIRPGIPALDITGGEPLIRKDIDEVMAYGYHLGFAPFVLNTNLLNMHRHEGILDHIDQLIVSLDSTNPAVWDSLVGVKNATERVMGALRKYAAAQDEKKFQININAVILPDHLDQILPILDFAAEIGVSFNAVPRVDGFTPNPDLVGNPEYQALIDELIRRKEQGYPVLNTNLYLRRVRDFLPYRCYATVTPKVGPLGEVYYPCTKMHSQAGNLLEEPSLWAVLKRAYRTAPRHHCGHLCYMSCYMEPIHYLEHPISFLLEGHLKRLVGKREPGLKRAG